MRHGIRAVAVVAILAGSGTVLASSPAVAAPSNCSTSADYSSVTIRCPGGSGEYRAYARCIASLWPDYTRYGRWTRVGSGTSSTATCDGIDRAYPYGYQYR